MAKTAADELIRALKACDDIKATKSESECKMEGSLDPRICVKFAYAGKERRVCFADDSDGTFRFDIHFDDERCHCIKDVPRNEVKDIVLDIFMALEIDAQKLPNDPVKAFMVQAAKKSNK